MGKKFCVISGQAGSVASNVKRNWFDTVDDAEAHAKNLIRKHYSGHGAKPIQLFVVGAEKVVEAGVPVITTREATPEDVGGAGDDFPEDD